MGYYKEFVEKSKKLHGCKTVEIGKSLFGRKLLSFEFGTAPKILFVGSIHAREFVTAELIFKMAQKNKVKGVAFMPLSNPDGVELCLDGVGSVPKEYRKFLLNINKSQNFSLWKANGRAVDLNVNFDADFGKGKQNRFFPSPSSYVGECAFSECEAKALRDYCKKFDCVLCYHSKGEVIYYGYGDNFQDKALADTVGTYLGYEVLTSVGSCGGLKDWFVDKGYGSSLTIECGNDELSHPIGFDHADELFEKHKDMPKIVKDFLDDKRAKK